jgi:hypothetical protein
MPADTKPDPTRDRPFQYSLRTLLFIMTGLCVFLGLMKWDPVIGILSVSIGSLVMAIWMSLRNQSSTDRLITVIVIIVLAVNGFMFVPCFVSGLVGVDTRDCLVRDMWLLSVALVALVSMVALIVAFRAHVRWLNVIAFVANGYLLCLCLALRFWSEDGSMAYSTAALFYMIPLNVIVLTLGVAYWRRTNRVDV